MPTAPRNKGHTAIAAEQVLQQHIARFLTTVEQVCGGRFTFAADQNGLRTSRAQASKAKAGGMRAGEPDIRIYLPDGRVRFIELKRVGGTVSRAQKDRHAALRALGFKVDVVFAACPGEGVDAVAAILVAEGILAGHRPMAPQTSVDPVS